MKANEIGRSDGGNEISELQRNNFFKLINAKNKVFLLMFKVVSSLSSLQTPFVQ